MCSNTTGSPSPRSESGRPSPAGILPADNLGAGRQETHAGVVAVRGDGFDAVVDEVEGADGVACALWVADETVGGGEVGGGVELLAVGGKGFR